MKGRENVRKNSVPLHQLCSDGVEGSSILYYIVNLANAESIEKERRKVRRFLLAYVSFRGKQ